MGIEICNFPTKSCKFATEETRLWVFKSLILPPNSLKLGICGPRFVFSDKNFSDRLKFSRDNLRRAFASCQDTAGRVSLCHSTCGRSSQLHGDRNELVERTSAVGSAGQTTSQRRDRPLWTVVPRPRQPCRRLDDQHQRHVHHRRRTRADHELHLPDPRLHRQGLGALEQPAAVPDVRRSTYVSREVRWILAGMEIKRTSPWEWELK